MIIGFDAKRAFHNSSGLGNYSRDMIRILLQYHPEHTYLLYNPAKPTVMWQPKGEKVEVRYPASPLWKMLSSIWRQGPIVKQLKADGVQIYHGLSNEIPKGLQSTRIKTIVTIHDLIFLRYPELFKPVDRKIYLHKFKYAAENADVVLAISEQTKSDIVDFLGVSPHKIRVHYQGCHNAFKHTYNTKDLQALRERLKLPPSFILNVGTIEKRKNALVLLQALKDLPYHLVMVGRPTEYKDELTGFARRNNFLERVHFIEGLSMQELAILYQLATLFCYPSVFEGFGIPIIEALFSKIPVITSMGSCFSEAGGPSSLYVNPTDVQGWGSSIQKLMEDEVIRRRMAAEGFAFAQKFRDEQVADLLVQEYLKLINT